MRHLLACLWIGVVGALQPVSAQVPDLEPGILAKDSDWETEVLQATASAQLSRLAESLSGDDRSALSAVLHPEAVAAPLRAAGEATSHGQLEILRVRPGLGPIPRMDLRGALEALRAAVGDDAASRVKFKVVGVHPVDELRAHTLVRYEALFKEPSGPVVQQTGRWTIQWSREKPDSSPMITVVDLVWMDEVRSPRPLMTEATSAVIEPSHPYVDWLRAGGERWHGRVDGLGEPNQMGHNGLAVGDADGDGDEDLYVAMGTALPNLLLIRQADGSLVNEADKRGVAWLDDTKGCLFADMDNDGDQDLLAAVGNAVVLARNDGTGSFKKLVVMRSNTPAAFYSLAAADFDGDGDLDVYGCRYVKLQYGISIPVPFHDANNGPANHLWRNDGDDGFSDATAATGLDANNRRFSLACVWLDYDLDGDQDLYVANDFGRNNLYRNDGGKFEDVAREIGVEDQAAGMGASVGDFDRDGRPDLYVTNMFSSAGNRIAYQDRFKSDDPASKAQIQRYALGNTLFRNEGGRFKDVSRQAGVRMGRWGWGARFCDLDNDSYDDIVAPNGFLTGRVKDDL